MTPLNIQTSATTTTETTITLTGAQIIEMLKERITGEIPNNASITFGVPRGGDYSGQLIDFKHDPLVVIKYKVTTSS